MKNQPPKHTSRRKNPQSNKAKDSESSSQPSRNPPVKKPPVVSQPDAVATSSSQTVDPTPTTVRPEPPQMATPNSTAPPPTTAVASTTTVDEPSPEQIMMEFLQKFGRGANASDFFARMAAACQQEEAASTLTPLEIPPRPSTLQETPTSQALTSRTGNPQILSETLAPVLPHAEAVESPHEKESEEAGGRDTKGRKGGRDEERASGDEGDERVAGENPEGNEGDEGDESVAEENPKDDERDETEGTGEGRETEEIDEKAVDDKEGRETEEGDDMEIDEREIPAAVVEGEVPDDDEGQTPTDAIADRKIEEVVDEDDGDDVRTARAVDFNEEEAGEQGAEKEVEADIVVLDDVPSDDVGTPTDERTTRRQSRRARSLEDTALANQQRKLRLNDSEETGEDIPQVLEGSIATEDVSPEALEKRYETERKRKGKQEAKPQKKKPRHAR